MTPLLAPLLVVLATFAITITSAFPIYTFPIGSASTLIPRSENTTSLTQLHNCLSSIGGSPQLSYPQDSSYANLSSSYNPLFHYSPLLIALPTSETELASIVKCVSTHQGQYKLSPRSGGHSYESYSLGGQDGSVVIDLSQLQSITVDSSKKEATVGAGVRLGTLAATLGKQAYKTNSDCAKAIVALQNLTLSTDADSGFEPEFGGELLIAGEQAGDFNGNSCQLSGQHINSTSQHHDHLMSRFHSLAGISPAQSSTKPFSSWLDALTDIMGNLNTTALLASGPDHEQFYAKSLIQPPTPTYSYSSALALHILV
ncbi:hypothetical protein NDA16_003207 [Ustilago loliicola]|nr:hypothetical protein NDA16_003207 [Ustilago loliicola]